MGWFWGTPADKLTSTAIKESSAVDQGPSSCPNSFPAPALSTEPTSKQSPSGNPLTSWSAWGGSLVPTTILVGGILLTARLQRKYFRRYADAPSVPQAFMRRRTMFGKVTSVGDGDDFRLFHTPGGRMAGWGWFRHVPESRTALAHQTIHVRIAGVDAPECGHFGRPAQPYADEALAWLRTYILGRRVRAHVHRQDQYSRVVATVYVRRGLFKKDVGFEMLRAGWATIYEGKAGAEFGGVEKKYRAEEKKAKDARRGIWRKGTAGESPMAYKARYKNTENKTEKKPQHQQDKGWLKRIFGS
ncbi:MAG: putative endonuclease lcl3 [Vezdaea aestivalis]|nr:MAG: putative endonuclease lcl3 [Vezdaea aestivalis]